MKLDAQLIRYANCTDLGLLYNYFFFSFLFLYLFYHISIITSVYNFFVRVISMNVNVGIAIFVVNFQLMGRFYKAFKLVINVFKYII